jgi:Peptidase family M1 domain
MSSLRRILEARTAVSKVTKVTGKTGRLAWLIVVLGCMPLSAAVEQPTGATPPGTAESLYLKLRSIGLDKTQVFNIREAALDRGALHITLDDGTIAFTEEAGGHVTGALFHGYGQILLSPPNTVERASLASFTGAAILSEAFSTAYLRFNDDVYNELKPFLRTAEDPAAFASQWNMAAQNLANEDALRLLLTFSEVPREGPSADKNSGDHMLHAMIEGNRFGAFDVRFDSLAGEQLQAGQLKRNEGQHYYDVWTSFTDPHFAKARIGDVAEPANSEFEITDYKIKAQVRPVKELEATTVLNIVARQGGHRALLFELSRLLQVKEVLADGRPVEFIHNQAIEGSQLDKRGNDVIAVVLPSPLKAGQKLELSFTYSGSVLSEAANGLLYVGEHGTWYPNRGFAMAWFDMEFSYPQGWTLVATGQRKEEKVLNRQQVVRWVSDRPVPVAGFNLGKYSQSVTRAGKLQVVTYATATVERGFAGTSETVDAPIPGFVTPHHGLGPLPMASAPLRPSPSRNEQSVGQASASAVEFYEKRFGPFPYGELALTQMPGTVSQGWPGLIFLSSYSFLTSAEKARLHLDPARQLLSDLVISHETAHQWWGDLVTWSSYRDQWIMEGLANYSALMLVESRNPEKFRQILQNYRDELMAKNRKDLPVMNAGPVTLGGRLSSSQFPDGYETICYGRGTWLFHMLRTMLRDAEQKSRTGGRTKVNDDEPFVRGLRKLRTTFEYKPISASEMMTIFASELPVSLRYEGRKSLDWFYESWVNGSAVPSFKLRDLKFTDRAEGTTVTGTIVQDHAPENLVTSVPLYASVSGKLVLLGRVFAEGHETQFRIAVPARSRKIVVDPEQTLLARR